MNQAGEDKVKKVTIMGLGLFGGGTGVAQYWANRGAKVTVTDLRDAEILKPSIEALGKFNIEYILEKHREEDFINTDLLVVNPAVKPDNKYVELAKRSGVPITTEIGLFITEHQKNNKSPIIAITGSNGKSTSTSLLSSIMSEQNSQTLSGGNIGGSLLANLGLYPSGTPAILELSSFQLHYLANDSFAPDISIITNLAPNHLDWHTTLDNYYTDKKNILSLQDKSQYTILNYQDPVLRKWAEETKSQVIFTSLEDHGLDNSAFIRDDNFLIRLNSTEELLAQVSSLRLPGKHNQENAIQALAGTLIYSKYINNSNNKKSFDVGLSKFTGLAHRQEVVADLDGVLFVNDSIATTPESTIAALNSYGSREIVLIAGGYDKDIPMENMCEEIIQKSKAVILIGQTARPIYDIIKRISSNFDAEVVETNFASAIQAAYKKTKTGVVLLSPGCASYGMFTNFQDRGNQFKEIAENLKS